MGDGYLRFLCGTVPNFWSRMLIRTDRHNFTRYSDAKTFNIYVYPYPDSQLGTAAEMYHHRTNGNMFWQHVFRSIAQYQSKLCLQDEYRIKSTDLCALNFTSNPNLACLLIPTVQYDCYLNKCDNGPKRDQHIQAMLNALSSWDNGRNHILFTTSDFELPSHEFAIRAHAGSELKNFSPCIDVSKTRSLVSTSTVQFSLVFYF